MKKSLIAALLIALFISVGAAGCIASEPIVGNWYIYSTDIPVVFYENGTGSLTISLLGINSTVPMTWEKIEEKTYTFTGTSVLFNAGTYTLSADGKTLVAVSTGITSFVKKA